LREIRIRVSLRVRNREACCGSVCALAGFEEGRASRRYIRRRCRVAHPVAEVLALEPEVSRPLIHELGENCRRPGASERWLSAGGAPRSDQRERRRGIT